MEPEEVWSGFCRGRTARGKERRCEEIRDRQAVARFARGVQKAFKILPEGQCACNEPSAQAEPAGQVYCPVEDIRLTSAGHT